jgi:lipid-A-disaccharide synthase
MLRIGLVAGEASGDLLGEGLIEAIRARAPDAVFEGVAGPRMVAAGCRALYPMERLSVIGLIEVLGRYRELYAMRTQLVSYFLANPPDVFIGIDAPDFNLGLEARLKARGIPAVHYVSPTIWAWRRNRLRKIGASVNLMLTLFPFEAAIYEEKGIPVRYVGHPFADTIPDAVDSRAARAALGLPVDGELIALLPGSRESEVRSLAPTFIGAARFCLERRPGLRFAVPLVNARVRALFEQALASDPSLPVTLFDGQARDVMAAADVVLLASGTAALEAMLLERPMVVAYRVSPITYWLGRRLLYVDSYAMPNLLAGEKVAPEFIQDAATPAAIGAALLTFLEEPAEARRVRKRFAHLHDELRQGANERAAEAVLALAGRDIEGVA